MGGRAEGLACADPGARAPIGMRKCIKEIDKYSKIKYKSWFSHSFPTFIFYILDHFVFTEPYMELFKQFPFQTHTKQCLLGIKTKTNPVLLINPPKSISINELRMVPTTKYYGLPWNKYLSPQTGLYICP